MLQLLNKWIKENVEVGLNKNNSIILPKWIRMKNDIIPGQEVIVSTHSGEIYIKRKLNESLENQMIISSRGSLWIPVEIRNRVKVESGTSFEVYTNDEKELKLVPVIKNIEKINN